jgi:hypothetical protein
MKTQAGTHEGGQMDDKARARLAYVAPELLEVLRICEGNISSLLASKHPMVYGVWLDVVRQAIAKATDDHQHEA